MNFKLSCRLSELNNVVYRYVDMDNDSIAYVGIVTNSSLPTRHKAHEGEEWYKGGNFLCEYIEVNTKSEAEAIESHLISLYNPTYNKAKVGWGLISFLPTEFDWKPFVPTYDDVLDDMRSAWEYGSEKRSGVLPERVYDWIQEFRYIDRVNEYMRGRNS